MSLSATVSGMLPFRVCLVSKKSPGAGIRAGKLQHHRRRLTVVLEQGPAERGFPSLDSL